VRTAECSGHTVLLRGAHSCEKCTPAATSAPLLRREHSCCEECISEAECPPGAECTLAARSALLEQSALLLRRVHSCCEECIPVRSAPLLRREHSCCEERAPGAECTPAKSALLRRVHSYYASECATGFALPQVQGQAQECIYSGQECTASGGNLSRSAGCQECTRSGGHFSWSEFCQECTSPGGALPEECNVRTLWDFVLSPAALYLKSTASSALPHECKQECM
jgi:hypothetical protein